MLLLFTFVQKAAEPITDPRRGKAIEVEPAEDLQVRDVPDRVYLRTVMDRLMEIPEAFAAAVEAMRAVREQFLLDGSLPQVS